MKDIQGSLIFALCLLAFTAVVFFFKYGQERAQSKMLEAESALVQNQAYNIEQEAKLKAEEAEKKAKSNLDKVKAAREMLEKSKLASQLTQKEIVDKLNAQLEREAEARLSAEKASEELAKQRDILNKTVAQTKNDLLRLQSIKRDSSTSKKIADMQEMLKAREAEIERLKRRQQELEELNAQARAAQISTEKEIENRGGLVLLPRHKRLISTR